MGALDRPGDLGLVAPLLRQEDEFADRDTDHDGNQEVAVFAGLLTKVGVYALMRAFTLIFVGDTAFTHGLILLAAALTRNPKLEVLLVNGIYDLATPYFAAVWTMDNLNLPADLRSAVVAEPGHAFVRADLGQIEPRILAAVSGDSALAAATLDADMYAPVARRLGVSRTAVWKYMKKWDIPLKN